MGRLLPALLAVAVMMLSGPATAGPAEVDDIVGFWNYSGGVVQVTGSGTSFTGTVVKATRFATCVHPVGEVMWKITKSGSSYTGTHPWFAAGDCTPGSGGLGRSTWTVSESGSNLVLRFCTTSPTNPSDTRCSDLTRAKPTKRECPKTYVIQPSGAKITANVKLVELDEKQIAGVIQKETLKYEGFSYTPIGEVTRKQNCAGYVMKSLFGARMVQANVEPDGFFRKIVAKYGEKRLTRVTARAGDVVVYRDKAGTVKHVAMVESNGVRMTIVTKDGDERLYRAKFPLGPLRLTNDPLVVNHAQNGQGSVEFWKLDTSRVRIEEVSPGQCDEK